jgi:hypothetical protein
MLAEIDGQTVNPKDVWKPTDLERFASPVAGMLQPPVILQGAQKCMTSMGESSTHHETEISILGSSPEATTESIALSIHYYNPNCRCVILRQFQIQQLLCKLPLLKSIVSQKFYQLIPKTPRIAGFSAPPLQTNNQLSPHSLARSLVALAHSTSSTS